MNDIEQFVTEQMGGTAQKLLEQLRGEIDLATVQYWAFERSSVVDGRCIHMYLYLKTSTALIFCALEGSLHPPRISVNRVPVADIAAIGALTKPYGYVILNTDAKELRKARFYWDQDVVIGFFRRVKNDLFG